jgi:DNA-binding NarL/FixJ family response regulator
VTSVLLVDDHPLIRQTLRRLLVREPDWQVIAEAEDGLAAVQLNDMFRPDVVVTDLTLPGLSGLEVIRRIHEQSRRTRIIVVSSHVDEQYVRQALSNGASGYVGKDEAGRHLLPAIRAALQNALYLSPSLAGNVGPLDRRSASGETESGG